MTTIILGVVTLFLLTLLVRRVYHAMGEAIEAEQNKGDPLEG